MIAGILHRLDALENHRNPNMTYECRGEFKEKEEFGEGPPKLAKSVAVARPVWRSH